MTEPTANRRTNVRLRNAMRSSQLTFPALAAKVGCDLKTAQRWVYEGRVPHRAQQVADVLGMPAMWLWPTLVGQISGRFEVAIPLGADVRAGVDVDVDVDEGPPVLWIATDTVVLRMQADTVSRDGRPDRSDRDNAAALLAAVWAYHDAVRADIGDPST